MFWTQLFIKIWNGLSLSSSLYLCSLAQVFVPLMCPVLVDNPSFSLLFLLENSEVEKPLSVCCFFWKILKWRNPSFGLEVVAFEFLYYNEGSPGFLAGYMWILRLSKKTWPIFLVAALAPYCWVWRSTFSFHGSCVTGVPIFGFMEVLWWELACVYNTRWHILTEKNYPILEHSVWTQA